MSATMGAYLFSLYSWLRSIFCSHGHVSSKRTTSRDSSLIKNTSGRRGVTNTWGGITPPLGDWKPVKSENREKPGRNSECTNVTIDFKTESCRQVKRPCSRATEQFERMWARVCIFPQNPHLLFTLLRHLFKLSAEGRVFMPALMANLKTPWGITPVS